MLTFRNNLISDLMSFYLEEGGGACALGSNVVRREGTSVNNAFFIFRRGISTLLKE